MCRVPPQSVDRRLRTLSLTVETWKRLRKAMKSLDAVRAVDDDCASGAVEAADHAIAVELPIITALRAASGTTSGTPPLHLCARVACFRCWCGGWQSALVVERKLIWWLWLRSCGGRGFLAACWRIAL